MFITPTKTLIFVVFDQRGLKNNVVAFSVFSLLKR